MGPETKEKVTFGRASLPLGRTCLLQFLLGSCGDAVFKKHASSMCDHSMGTEHQQFHLLAVLLVKLTKSEMNSQYVYCYLSSPQLQRWNSSTKLEMSKNILNKRLTIFNRKFGIHNIHRSLNGVQWSKVLNKH